MSLFTYLFWGAKHSGTCRYQKTKSKSVKSYHLVLFQLELAQGSYSICGYETDYECYDEIDYLWFVLQKIVILFQANIIDY